GRQSRRRLRISVRSASARWEPCCSNSDPRSEVMRKPAASVASGMILFWVVLTLPIVLRSATSNRQTDVMSTSRGELRLTPLYHGRLRSDLGGRAPHVDPGSKGDYTVLKPANLIVIPHPHADPLDRTMVEKWKKPATVIAAPPAVIDTLNCAPACGDVEAVSDSEKKTVMGISFEGVPMDNLVQGSATGKPFHHKGIGSGYVLGFGGHSVRCSGVG